MRIQINQLGYTPSMKKYALLRGQLSKEVHILNETGHIVMTLPVGNPPVEIWGDPVYTVDFPSSKKRAFIFCAAGRNAPIHSPWGMIPIRAVLPPLWICSIISAAGMTWMKESAPLPILPAITPLPGYTERINFWM